MQHSRLANLMRPRQRHAVNNPELAPVKSLMITHIARYRLGLGLVEISMR